MVFYDYFLKFIIVGDSDVGKNEILDYFKGSLDSAAGINSKILYVDLEDKKVKLQLWDASGQGRFCTIIRSYSRGAHGVILVYDITNKWSFKSIDRWLKEIDSHLPGIPKILIGNRLHLEYKRQIPQESANQYGCKHNMELFEISPLCNFNVVEAIKELICLALHRIGMQKILVNKTVKSLHELCFISLMKFVRFYQIHQLCLPEPMKKEFVVYYLAHNRKLNELRSLPTSTANTNFDCNNNNNIQYNSPSHISHKNHNITKIYSATIPYGITKVSFNGKKHKRHFSSALHTTPTPQVSISTNIGFGDKLLNVSSSVFNCLSINKTSLFPNSKNKISSPLPNFEKQSIALPKKQNLSIFLPLTTLFKAAKHQSSPKSCPNSKHLMDNAKNESTTFKPNKGTKTAFFPNIYVKKYFLSTVDKRQTSR